MSEPAAHQVEEPWSPFPVQDWSSLPEDPLAPVPAGPTADAPRPPRWWAPLAVIAAIGLVLTGATYVATPAATGSSDPPVLRFLPADGTASYARVESTRQLTTTSGTEVTESALLSGYTAVLSTDSGFGIMALGSVYGQAATLRVWRTTTTTISGAAADPKAAAPQTTRLYRLNDGIELLGENGPGGGYAYRPGLLELPPDAAVGSTWSSAGSASDTLDYRSEFRADRAAGGCLNVTGAVRYASKKGVQNRVVSSTREWCPGSGVTTATTSAGDVAVRSVTIQPPAPTGIVTTDTPVRWADPTRWTAKQLNTVSADPGFGDGPMNGSTLGALTPVRTESGVVVRAMAAPRDLIATVAKTATTWTSTWRTHPGGAILSVAAFGNVIVVTTSDRQVVGYSATGARLWRISLDELAPAAPLRVSDASAVLVDLSGEVRHFDLATGAVDWSRNVGSDVSVAPAVGAGLVVVADRSSTVTALDSTTGDQRWTQSLDATAVAVLVDTVVVVQDQSAHGLAGQTGQHRWLRHFDGTVTRLVPFGERLVLATSSGSMMLDLTGAVTVSLGAYFDVTATPDFLVGWGRDRAELIDPTGRVVSGWDIPSVTVVSESRPGVATPQGVLLFNLDWTFTAWTDG